MPTKLFFLSIITSIFARLSFVWESFWGDNHPTGHLQDAEPGLEAILSMGSCCLSLGLQARLGFPNTLEGQLKLASNIAGALIHSVLCVHHTASGLTTAETILAGTIFSGAFVGLASVEAALILSDFENEKMLMELFVYIYIFIKVQNNVVILSSFVNSLCSFAVELQQVEINHLCAALHAVGALFIFGAFLRCNREALSDCWAWFVESLRGARDQLQETLLVKLRDARDQLQETLSGFLVKLRDARDQVQETLNGFLVKLRDARDQLQETLSGFLLKFSDALEQLVVNLIAVRSWILRELSNGQRLMLEKVSSARIWFLAKADAAQACFKAQDTRRLEV